MGIQIPPNLSRSTYDIPTPPLNGNTQARQRLTAELRNVCGGAILPTRTEPAKDHSKVKRGRGHLALLEGGTPLEQIPKWQPARAHVSLAPDQAQYLREFGLQVPAHLLLRGAAHSLDPYLPLMALTRYLRNYWQTPTNVQTASENWRTTGLHLRHASTPSEFLASLNSALERGLSPVALLYGLYSLPGMAAPMIPVHLLAAVIAGYGQDRLSEWLYRHVGAPSLEVPRTLQELARLLGNCARLGLYTQPVLNSLNECFNAPASGPLRLTHANTPEAIAEIRNQWERDKHTLAHGDASPGEPRLDLSLVQACNPQTVATQVQTTSAGARPGSLLNAFPRTISGVIGWFSQRMPYAEREADVEMPLVNPDLSVDLPGTPFTTPIGQYLRVIGTGLGFGAVAGATWSTAQMLRTTTTGTTGAPTEHALAPTLKTPSAIPPELTPHEQTLWQALKLHSHLTPEGTLTSTLEAVMQMVADPVLANDRPALQAKVGALLHQDLGPLPAQALDITHARARRSPVIETADGLLVRNVIALADQTLHSPQRQDEKLLLQALAAQWNATPAWHWLGRSSAGEQALWLNYAQARQEHNEHLATLAGETPLLSATGSRLAHLQAQRPALKKALASLYEIELQQALLESKLKGYLRGAGELIAGLEVVTAAVNGDPLVQVGSLQLSTGNGTDALKLPLPQLQVFVRRDARSQEDGAVLYRPEERRVQAFGTRQEMFQHLDMKRLLQSLNAEVQLPEARASLTAFERLPELALRASETGHRPTLMRFLDERARLPSGWTEKDLQVRFYPGASLLEKLEQRASVQLDRQARRLQVLEANPEIDHDMAAAQASGQKMADFIDEYLPTLRTLTQRNESKKLTNVLRNTGALATNSTLDADAVYIHFNDQTMSWTDWVMEGYRQHGDNVLASSNNFIKDARLETEDPTVMQTLNSQSFKQSVQSHLRNNYAGDAYINHLEQWLDPGSECGRTFRELRTNSTLLQMQAALTQAKANGAIDSEHFGALKVLVDGLRTRTVQGWASLQAFQINGRRIPEVFVLSLHQPSGLRRADPALRSDYLFLPHGPYGSELLKLSDYQRLMKTPGYYEDVLARTPIKDKQVVDQVLRGQHDYRSPTAFVRDFTENVSTQWLHDKIDNARQVTTSRAEAGLEQLIKGLRFATGAVCTVATAGVGAIPCTVGTLGLVGHDMVDALKQLDRGHPEGALTQLALLTLDMLDVVPGLRALNPAKLLHWVGKAHFSTASEASEALQTLARQRGTAFTASGRLNDALACPDISLIQLSEMTLRPGKARAGNFYQHNGQHFIRDRYQGQWRMFEVYSDNGWATVRVRDPNRPNGQGAPVHYHEGHWRADEGGLLGGVGGLTTVEQDTHGPTETVSGWLQRSWLHEEPMQHAPTRPVSSEFLTQLQQAYDESFHTKLQLPFGSPDQRLDQLGSKGEAWQRLKLISSQRLINIPQGEYQKMVDHVQSILWVQAGNCGENAQVAFVNLARNPAFDNKWIALVKARGDHAYVIITDLPNVPHSAELSTAVLLEKIDPESTIVVDTWPALPIVHTLDDNTFGIGSVSWVRPPCVALPPPSASAKQGLASIDDIRKYHEKKRGYEPPGQSLVDMARRDPLLNKYYLHMVSAAKYRRFNAPDGTAFDNDKIPIWYGEKLRNQRTTAGQISLTQASQVF